MTQVRRDCRAASPNHETKPRMPTTMSGSPAYSYSAPPATMTRSQITSPMRVKVRRAAGLCQAACRMSVAVELVHERRNAWAAYESRLRRRSLAPCWRSTPCVYFGGDPHVRSDRLRERRVADCLGDALPADSPSRGQAGSGDEFGEWLSAVFTTGHMRRRVDIRKARRPVKGRV